WSGQNPPPGAVVYYWLEKEPEGDVTLEVLDPEGKVVSRLSSKPLEPSGSSEYVKEETEGLAELALAKKKGVQKAVWGFDWEGAEMIQGGVLDAGYPRFGPQALPGTYTLKLTADGKTVTAPLTVRPDPRAGVSPEDQAAQLQFALEVRDAITRLTRAVERLRSVRKQLTDRNAVIAKDEKAKPLAESAKALIAKLDDLEARIHNPKAVISYDVLALKGGAQLYSRLSPFFGWVTDGSGAPTQGMKEVFAEQEKELAGYEKELDQLLGSDLAAVNAQAGQLGMGWVVMP
ncbi:MAG TPA: hypothetical protein VJ725_10620, partial [Thermoanaerobaculia bacterium]|nr:hypothetical protein [Thermoanaerobaculia bacterium]